VAELLDPVENSKQCSWLERPLPAKDAVSCQIPVDDFAGRSPRQLVWRAVVRIGVRGVWPDDRLVLAAQDDKALPQRRIPVIRAVYNAPVDVVIERSEGIDERIEDSSFFLLDRSAVLVKGSPVRSSGTFSIMMFSVGTASAHLSTCQAVARDWSLHGFPPRADE